MLFITQFTRFVLLFLRVTLGGFVDLHRIVLFSVKFLTDELSFYDKELNLICGVE